MLTKNNLKKMVFEAFYKPLNQNIENADLYNFINNLSKKIIDSEPISVNLFLEDADAWKYDNLEDYSEYFSFDSSDSIPDNFISDFNNKKNMGWHYSFTVPKLFLPFFSNLIQKENNISNGEYEFSETLPSFVKVTYEHFSYIPFLTDEALYMKSSDQKLNSDNPICKKNLLLAENFLEQEISKFLTTQNFSKTISFKR